MSLGARAQVLPSFIFADSIAQTVGDLAGPGVVVLSATYQYVPEHLGSFTDSIGSIGMHGGIMLATGHVFVAQGPNFSQTTSIGGGYAGMMDPDLQQVLIPQQLLQSDAAILTLALVPLGDSLQLRYVFASEEYNEWVCTAKNDAVGMFLSGPGINGTFSNGGINMATLPGTGLPVMVNTVNLGIPGFNSTGFCGMYPLWEQDSVYYVDNTYGIHMQLDGYTTVLTAKAAVTAGATYQLRIAIADVDDANYDSAVFLEYGSLTSDMSTTTEEATGMSEPTLWRDPSSGRIVLTGFDEGGAPVIFQVHDAAGRCVVLVAAERDGDTWTAPLLAAAGLYVVRAVRDQQVSTGRILVP